MLQNFIFSIFAKNNFNMFTIFKKNIECYSKTNLYSLQNIKLGI